MRFFVSILIVCLLGSCASVNKGVFIKRKYNKGYYVNIASHKRTSGAKENKSDHPKIKNETTEIVVVEQDDATPSFNSISEVKKECSSPPNKKPLSFSNSANEQTTLVTIKENVKKKLTFRIQQQKSSYSDAQAGIGLIFFLLLTIVYAFAIVLYNPGFPVLLAIVIAMIGALLTLLTGIMFI